MPEFLAIGSEMTSGEIEERVQAYIDERSDEWERKKNRLIDKGYTPRDAEEDVQDWARSAAYNHLLRTQSI